MPQEEVKTETQPPVVETKVETPQTIAVDIDGISINVDLDTGKRLIEARQKVKKEVKDLQEKVSKAEASARQEADRAKLIEAMKSSDIDSVRSQISKEYLDKISTYENKIFKGEVKSLLATQGVLAEALEDATSLALQGTKVTLDGDVVKINDKDAKEYLGEWVKTRPHLVSVKATEGKKVVKVTTPKAPDRSGADRLASGIGKFIKA